MSSFIDNGLLEDRNMMHSVLVTNKVVDET